ncbi:hypothetical protein HMN09_00358500 [Mycena chlorophos]|uniref:Uncharacterized protein n=1 Tax=Mycena chlorophos TaxID=658473 RepID=A0A8H6TGX0_MYCCL|nr:hypothetical protein HMN09_00358500 [Mycena chlorophos]
MTEWHSRQNRAYGPELRASRSFSSVPHPQTAFYASSSHSDASYYPYSSTVAQGIIQPRLCTRCVALNRVAYRIPQTMETKWVLKCRALACGQVYTQDGAPLGISAEGELMIASGSALNGQPGAPWVYDARIRLHRERDPSVAESVVFKPFQPPTQFSSQTSGTQQPTHVSLHPAGAPSQAPYAYLASTPPRPSTRMDSISPSHPRAIVPPQTPYWRPAPYSYPYAQAQPAFSPQHAPNGRPYVPPPYPKPTKPNRARARSRGVPNISSRGVGAAARKRRLGRLISPPAAPGAPRSLPSLPTPEPEPELELEDDVLPPPHPQNAPEDEGIADASDPRVSPDADGDAASSTAVATDRDTASMTPLLSPLVSGPMPLPGLALGFYSTPREMSIKIEEGEEEGYHDGSEGWPEEFARLESDY